MTLVLISMIKLHENADDNDVDNDEDYDDDDEDADDDNTNDGKENKAQRKSSQSREEKQQTQRTYSVESGIEPTPLGGKRVPKHCAKPFPLQLKNKKSHSSLKNQFCFSEEQSEIIKYLASTAVVI